jgi:DNA polymerase III delta subunit
MPPLTRAALRTQLASGTLDRLYVLIGEDEVDKASAVAEFVETVDEGLRAFNVDRLYGGESSVDQLIDVAATLPMMAPQRLVMVLEAEKLLIPKRESKAAEEELKRLEAFVADPPPHAAIVFVAGPLDRRRRVVKALLSAAQVVEFGTLAEPADAEQWLRALAARSETTLAADALKELLAGSTIEVKEDRTYVKQVRIDRLRAAFERALLYTWGSGKITGADVRQSVPGRLQQHRDFGIAPAIRDGNAAVALRQLGLALDAGEDAFPLLGQIRWAAENLPPARLRDGIRAVFRTDLALKSTGGDARILLERLVVELCGAGQRGGAAPGVNRGRAR